MQATQITLLDGGTGSELRRRGVPLGPDCWSAAANLSHPATVRDIHADYIRAGADVITTNTFAASRYVLKAAGLGERVDAVVSAAVTAAKDAIAHTERPVLVGGGNRAPVRVAGSLSTYPPGQRPDTYPDVATELDAYRESAAHLARANVDLLFVEMAQDPVHAALACRAAAESGLPFWLGVSCRVRNIDRRLVGYDRRNVLLTDTLDALLPHAPAAIIVMHAPLDAIDAALEVISDRHSGALGAAPALPYAEDPSLETPEAADAERPTDPQFAAAVRRWIGNGVTIVGGCCGSTPAQIAMLRQVADSA